MLKTISAALLAVSVLAAPALAASPATKTAHAPVIKAAQMKSGVLDANARMGRHHHYWHHRHYRHHRFHKR
jgi:hypothetical protein